jgi:hypothetical protein
MNQVPRCFIIGIVMLFLLSSLAQASLQDGLVLYLPFDEGQGTVAKDLSGKGHDGVIKGAEWVNGQLGSALKFSSDDTFVTVPFAADFKITDGITLSAWVTSNSAGFRGIINAQLSTYGPFLLQQGNAGMGELGLFVAGAWLCSQTKGLLEKDTFHHLVATYDKNVGEHFYFDGVIDEALNQAPAGAGLIDVAADEAGIGIGHNYGFAGRFFDGVIDEVVIYNRGLSAAEVTALFNASPVVSAVKPNGKLATAWGDIKK